MSAHHLPQSNAVVFIERDTDTRYFGGTMSSCWRLLRVGRKIGARNKVHGKSRKHMPCDAVTPALRPRGPDSCRTRRRRADHHHRRPRSFPPPPRTRPPCSRLAPLDLDPLSDRLRSGPGTVRIYPLKTRSRYRSSTCVQSPETLLFATPLPSGECHMCCV